MKKHFIALFALLLIGFSAQAQDEGAKLAKGAGRALTSYNIDPANNGGKLDEAKSKINDALKQADAQALSSAWLTKGDVYNTIVQRDMGRRIIDANAPLSGENDALVAFEAYKKAYELAAKKYEKKDATKGIVQIQGHLVNIGAMKFEAGEYDKAYYSWAAATEAEGLLKAEDETGIFNEAGKMEEQRYFTAVAASNAKMNKEALAIYEALAKEGTNRPAVYEGICIIKTELGDAVGADAALAEGRSKFPNDTGLLFAEINSYLTKGKLDELTSRLEEAIKKEPENVSLYITLGNVYDNLFQRELANKDNDKATAYFDKAKSQYQAGLDRDPRNSDATYSMGALYYNKAAAITVEINQSANDFSTEGLKKTKMKQKEVMDLFDQALPYFQKAENLNPNDLNTLIALTEIYARKDDFTMSGEFKKRMEVVKGGGTNSAPYFK